MIVRLLTRYYLGRRPACCGQRVLLNLVVYGIFVTVFVITFYVGMHYENLLVNRSSCY